MEPVPYHRPSADGAAPDGYDSGNFAVAFLAGLVAALLGAVLWAAFVGATHIRLGIAAIGIGFLVGWAMRQAGKGHSPVYGYAAIVLALFGCVAGDLLRDCVLLAEHYSRPLEAIIMELTPPRAVALLQAGFQPLNVLFYLIAARAGYRYAFSKH